MKDKDLFDQNEDSKPGQRRTEWRLATNHLNLFFMLGTGLILPSNAFGEKYYVDSLSVAPGWLPLFSTKPAQGLVEHCLSEASHLIPCIVVLDLSCLSGPVYRWSADGGLHSEMFEDAQFDEIDWLMVKAPLPLTCIKKVEVESAPRKKALMDSAKDLRNVDLGDITVRARKASFTANNEMRWTGKPIELEQNLLNMPELSAVGGFLALCAKVADRSERLSDWCISFYGGKTQADLGQLLSIIDKWLCFGSPGDGLSHSGRLLWDLHRAIQHEEDASLSDTVIDYLEKLVPDMDGKAQIATRSLIDDLRGIERLTEKTEEEMLAGHTKPLSRALVLVLLKPDPISFLEFDKGELRDEEFLIAAFLLSSIKGWIEIPEELRSIPGLQSAISHKMAEFAHRTLATGVKIGSAPPRPQSLRELFKPGARGLSKAQREAAVTIAKAMNWDMIQTQIRLPKGSYELQVTPAGILLSIPGEADVVDLVVDDNDLLKRLGRTILPISIEKEARKKLGALPS